MRTMLRDKGFNNNKFLSWIVVIHGVKVPISLTIFMINLTIKGNLEKMSD